jgi:predicted nucleic acid-binding Zn ribbon protein
LFTQTVCETRKKRQNMRKICQAGAVALREDGEQRQMSAPASDERYLPSRR